MADESRWEQVGFSSNEYLRRATIRFNHVHAYSGQIVEATCSASGYGKYTCECGVTYEETFPKLPHTYANEVCTVCGVAENIPGDLDDSKVIDVDDAIYLLQHILMPDLFTVKQDVDYNGNGTVDIDDAIYLLQYVLMPEQFPI